MKYPDFSLIIACFNEEKHLEASIWEIEKVLKMSKFSYETIFIDDKSVDKTLNVIKKIVKGKKNYNYFFHKKNEGRGKTVSDGILKAKGKVVGFIDIDLEVSPVYIPYFINLILSGEDVVVGQRIYHTNLAFLHREIFSRGYSFLVRKMLKIPFKDTESGYKFFNRVKILPILRIAKNRHWFWDTEIMALSFLSNLRIKEVPVLFVKNPEKKSTVNLWKDIPVHFINLLSFRASLDNPLVKKINGYKRLGTYLAIFAGISLFSIGKTIHYYFYTDDFAILYLIQNNSSYPWPYSYDSVVLSLIYKIFGTSTYPYFTAGVVTYFVSSIAVYFFIRILTRNNLIAFFSAAIFATGFIGVDQFSMMSVSIMNNLNIINVCLTLILFIKWLDSKKIIFYFAAVTMFTVSLFFIPYRAFPLILFLPIIEFFLTFQVENWRKIIRKIFFLGVRFIPFVMIAYYLGILTYGKHESTQGEAIVDFIISKTLIFFNTDVFQKVFSILGQFVILKPVLSESIYFTVGLIFFVLAIGVGLFYFKKNKRLSRSLFIALFLTIAGFIGILRLIPNLDSTNITNRYLTISLIGYSAILPPFFYMLLSEALPKFSEKKLKKAVSIILVSFIVALALLSRQYTQDILKVRGDPARKFYSQLRSYIPHLSEKNIFFFDHSDSPFISMSFNNILLGAYMSKDVNIAVHYKQSIDNVKIIDNFSDFIKSAADGKNYYSFYYDKDGLSETTSRLRSLLANGQIREIYKDQVSYKKGINPQAEISFDNASSLLPMELSMTVKVAPLDSSMVSFPYFEPGVNEEKKDEVKKFYAGISKNHYFDYFLARKKYYDSVLVEVSSSHVSGNNNGEKATDNDINSLWLSNESQWQIKIKPSLKIDLGEERDISKIIISNISESRTPKVIELFTSLDKKYWQKVKITSQKTILLSDRNIEIENFSPLRTRYFLIKIVSTKGGITPGISEVEALESEFGDIDTSKALRMLDHPFEYIRDIGEWNREYVYIQKNASGEFRTLTNKDIDINNSYNLRAPLLVDNLFHEYRITIPPRGTVLKKAEIEIPFPATLEIAQLKIISD